MKTAENIVLEIVFEYLSGNDNVLELIRQIAEKHQIKGFVQKKDDTVSIVVSAPLEKVQEFSKELGEKIPYSIFMSEVSTQAVEDFSQHIPDRFEIKGDINILPQNKGICPSCLSELLTENSRRFYFPFISCSYCGGHYAYLYEYPFQREKTVFKFFQMCEECKKEYENTRSFRHSYPLTACHSCLVPIYLKKGENERYGFDSEKTVGAFNTAAGIIKKGNLLRVYTSNGEKILGIINSENVEKIKGISDKKLITVLFTNAVNLSKYLVLSDLETRVLLSQEKPVVKVRASEQLKEKSLVSPFDFIKAKLPDDPILVLLSYHLKNLGIDYILIEDISGETQKDITDFKLNADLPVINTQKDAEIIVIDRHIIIEKGEKGILPNIIKSKSTGNLSIAGDYAALDLGDGEYLIDRKEKILSQLNDFVDSINQLCLLEGENTPIDIPHSKKKIFKAYQGATLSVMAEHRILDQPVISFYFSDIYGNVISVKSHTKPLTPLIKIMPINVFDSPLKTAKWIINQIESSSPEGEKLIKNLSKNYPHIVEKLQQIKLDENYAKRSSIITIFEIISYILEITPDSLSKTSYLHLQNTALKFKGKKGVKIDYILDEKDGQFYLNWIKTVQSVISYKLAGAETDMIAFSVLEGFGEWLINQLNTIKSKLKIENTVISGSIFSDPVITGKFVNFASKNGKLFINKRLPIDNYNITFGGIFT